MKTTSFAFLVAAGFAAAATQQGLQDVPKCADPCIEQATTGNQIGGCGQFDIKCICSNKDFLSNIACCLENKCDASGKAAAVTFAKQICSTVSVTVPDEVVCNASSSASSSTAAKTETGSATGSPTPSASSGASETSSAAASTGTAGSSDKGDAATGLSSVAGLVGAAIAMAFAL